MNFVPPIFFLLVLFAPGLARAGLTPAEIEFFESEIRPVLAQECYECHNSRGKAKSGLILDHRDALLRGGDSGPAIVPGDASASLLVEAIEHRGDLAMPKAGVRLDPPVIAAIRRWIDMGAPDPRDDPPTEEELSGDEGWETVFETRLNWWSFQPIERPPVPGGAATPIDRFIREKLSANELSPSSPADPRVLARRLHFALVGLPPSPDRLRQFVDEAAGDRESAVRSLVEELLASPHFGEKWARHWMDWVRYAESHGSEGDPRIDNAHHYRDYLIRALNSDVPYDQMLREHVAGDLLPEPRLHPEEGFNESILGAIHWRMVFHGFAPTDALEEKVRFTDDQINTFTKAFQGLTVSCARCHNHKFDAISQADYYAMFGILGSTRPGRKLIETPAALDRHRSELEAIKPEIRQALAREWLASLDEMEKRLRESADRKEAADRSSIFHVFHLLEGEEGLTPAAALRRVLGPVGPALDPVEGETLSFRLDSGDDHLEWFRYGNGVSERPEPAGALLLSTAGGRVVERILPSGIYSGLLSTKHAGRFTSPDFDLDEENRLFLLVDGGGKALARYVVQNYPRKGTVFRSHRFGAGGKGRGSWSWRAFDLAYWTGDSIHIEMATARDTAVLVEPEDRSWFGIRGAKLIGPGKPAPVDPSLEYLGAIAREADHLEPASVDDLVGIYRAAIRESLLAWQRGEISDAQALLLDELIHCDLLPNTVRSLPSVRPLIERYRELESEVIVPTRVPGLDEWTGRDQPLFDRGNHKKPLEPVSRRFLEAVDDEPYRSLGSGRLELAQDLIREDNPFTRRVAVNRVWTHLFGNGITGSVDNFGRLGEEPSHPELLDYLAARFGDELSWSLKALIREIVLSETWQQSSTASPRAREIDPENRLLSHFSVRRLEAELIRDKLLSVSGKLDLSLFGPAILGGGNRRSVYASVIRNRLHPFLAVFDAPIPFSTTGQRQATNVPAQSLTLLNDPEVAAHAEVFAARYAGMESRDRIAAMWERALGRKPSAEEWERSLEFIGALELESDRIADEFHGLSRTADRLKWERERLLSRVRDRLGSPGDAEPAPDRASLGAVAHWDFAQGAEDVVAGIAGRLEGNARIEDGVLRLDGQSAFFSDPISRDLGAKTLEVIVTLDRLDQRGGGAITVQDLQGDRFDSIVFAERRPGEWMPGSNRFARTSDFGGPPETAEGMASPVHFVIAYDQDGTIRGYRNGLPYGEGYVSRGPEQYRRDEAQVVLGLRHGRKSGGNRNLTGAIHLAAVYDRALAPGEIAALASSGRQQFASETLLEAMTIPERDRFRQIEEDLARTRARMAEGKDLMDQAAPEAVWANFAHALFNLKEFIHVY